MAEQIATGDTIYVSHDIIIEGQTAFTRGQSVVVESISQNPSRPEYKYVVNSPYLQKRFQLSDNDVTIAISPGEPASAPPQPAMSPRASAPQQSVAREKGAGFWNARNLAALIILIALIAVGIYAVPKVTHWLNSPADQGTPSVVPSGNSDTAVPANEGTITRSEYDQLQNGMTYEQTVSIIGGDPTSKNEGTDNSGSTTIGCEWRIEGERFGIAHATFVNNALVSKWWQSSP